MRLLLPPLLALAAVEGGERPWMDRRLGPAQRAERLVDAMTIDEKITIVHGNPPWTNLPYGGHLPANTRLGIPSLTMNDGPSGFRCGACFANPTQGYWANLTHGGTSTCWPSALTASASWDVALMEEWGAAMGAEFRDKGADIQLGPGVCIARVPVGGRNFEVRRPRLVACAGRSSRAPVRACLVC